MGRNWRSMRRWLKAMLVRHGHSSDDADDLVQEALLRLAVYEQEAPVAKPGAFLLRVAINLAIDAGRMRAAHGEEVVVEELALVDSAPGTEAAVLARERLARLDVCLRRLGSKTQAIFVDVRFGGLSYAEAARHHRITISGVEKHVAKATMLIANWMEGW